MTNETSTGCSLTKFSSEQSFAELSRIIIITIVSLNKIELVNLNLHVFNAIGRIVSFLDADRRIEYPVYYRRENANYKSL